MATSAEKHFGTYDPEDEVAQLKREWNELPHWQNIRRNYTAEEVIRLRGSLKEVNVVATRGARLFRDLINGKAKKPYVNALGALTGGQAVQMVKGGLEAIYVSGWQVAADNNSQLATYPDQSLYPVDSVPRLVQAINNSFRAADRIQWANGVRPGDPQYIDYFVPVVADAEAGFGGVLNAYELCRHLIDAGAAVIHIEDQLSSAKKCGHLGGKVLVPTSEAIQKLTAARLAADVANVPTVLIARTDAYSAVLQTSDADLYDAPFLTGKRTDDGFFFVKPGIDQAIARGLAYAPYADLLWCETATPSLEDARKFATSIHAKFPKKLLAYNCSPSFNWRKNLSEETIANFQDELAKMGYVFQFITLAGIHSAWYNIFDLASHYAKGQGIKHYVEKVQAKEFAALEHGYTFVAHQQEVGVGYFDTVTRVIQQHESGTCAMKGSTEEDQFTVS